MIYRIYFDKEVMRKNHNAHHKYGETLLEYALLHEKQIIYKNQTVIYNKWGKPLLRDHPHIQYNISHCEGMAACVLADVPVGIDVENIRPFSEHAARRVCDQQEIDDIMKAKDPNRQFFTYWTLKESCVKAMGCGMAYPLKKVVFRIIRHEIECVTRPEYQFLLLENDKRHVMAVCCRHAGASRIGQKASRTEDVLHGKTAKQS